jgi:hypothetical protein
MHTLNPPHTAYNVRSSIQFAPGNQSKKTVTTSGAVSVSMQTEPVQLEFAPGTVTIPEPMHENTDDKVVYELA